MKKQIVKICAKSARGAALLTVLIAMMIISIVLFEFQYSSMIERKLSFNELNQLQAYYLAKSGAKIGLLRLAIYNRAKKDPGLAAMRKNVPNIDSMLDAIWQLPLPPFPPKEESLNKLSLEDKSAAEQVLKQTRVEEGFTTHTITNESGKINLNFLSDIPPQYKDQRITFRDKPQNLFEFTGQSLVNAFEGFVRDSENPNEEWPNLRPEEQVLDIIDWVTPGNNRLAGGSKDAFYEQQNPAYKAKKYRFFTLDELKMVKGVDDKLFNKMKPLVTVYSYDGKINLNSMSNDMLRILYKDFTEEDIKRINEEKDKNDGWASEAQFVQFVTDTLGRGGFKTQYADPNNYPFTVSSQSFLIESLGLISRSKSQIQKVIRVAVAMSGGRGGKLNNAIKDQATCEKTPGYFWHRTINACYMKARTEQECVGILAGTVRQGDPRCPAPGMFCTQPNGFDFCYSQTDAAAFKDATAMKILSWSES